MTTPSYEDLERKVTYLEVVVAQHEEQARATLRGYGMGDHADLAPVPKEVR
jgi:hypothetical protein